MGSPQNGEGRRLERTFNEGSPHTNSTEDQSLPSQHDPSLSAPIEMTRIEEQHPVEDPPKPSEPLGATSSVQPSQLSQSDHPPPDTTSTGVPPVSVPQESIAITSTGNDPTSASAPPHPLTREKTGPAIGPSIDKAAPMPLEADTADRILVVTLLLITGARHPFKIDDKYLKKRGVNIDGDTPSNMSVYTLKELIWREWRDDWETRPSSPGAIRLIYYGKMLEDKSRLNDCRFQPGLTPHVVHMTIKPQEIIDEEDAKNAKPGSRDRDGNERTPGCRCRPIIFRLLVTPLTLPPPYYQFIPNPLSISPCRSPPSLISSPTTLISLPPFQIPSAKSQVQMEELTRKHIFPTDLPISAPQNLSTDIRRSPQRRRSPSIPFGTDLEFHASTHGFAETVDASQSGHFERVLCILPVREAGFKGVGGGYFGVCGGGGSSRGEGRAKCVVDTGSGGGGVGG
ncbi:MAG: hypothetical protein Q9174_003092 [Haloplaca sp. 1 TL-2023]